MISPIHYIYITSFLTVLRLRLRINDYCIPVSIFKAIGQLLNMGVLHFKDWCAIAVVIGLDKIQWQRTPELEGVHVHIMFMPSGFTGVRRGDGDAKNYNIT